MKSFIYPIICCACSFWGIVAILPIGSLFATRAPTQSEINGALCFFFSVPTIISSVLFSISHSWNGKKFCFQTIVNHLMHVAICCGCSVWGIAGLMQVGKLVEALQNINELAQIIIAISAFFSIPIFAGIILNTIDSFLDSR